MSQAVDIEQLYRAHARRLAGYLMRATGDPEVAADLTAETFAAALIARERYREELGAPTTWLYGIAAHKLTDWRRRGYAEDRARRVLLTARLTWLHADGRRGSHGLKLAPGSSGATVGSRPRRDATPSSAP